jgi:hypothetical protein
MANLQKKKKWFFERLKLLDCSCVRSHLRIPYNYRNGIGGIFNVSFCSLCFFWAKFNKHTKNLSLGKSSKNHVPTVFYVIWFRMRFMKMV